MRTSIYRLLFRNKFTREGNKALKGKVNLEYYSDAVNLGDYLSLVICQYMLSRRGVSFSSDSVDGKTKHLLAVGSILGGSGDFDATVWGSGVRCFSSVRGLTKKSLYQKLDVRAVRGPLTRDALMQCGYECPQVYGDPAVLLPMIYQPRPVKKQGTVLITHYLTAQKLYQDLDGITLLDIQTKDYRGFIDKIASAERVISSSLHGIILAETYGAPAVFLRKGIESETLKFYDWYFSTRRYDVKVAMTLEEAVRIIPMPLPDLAELQEGLLRSFPYDMWGKT